MELTTVNNFFYYMWNRWSATVANDLFGYYLGKHIWEKWQGNVEYYGPTAAVSSFYAELDNECRKTIIEAANKYYNK